MPAVMMAASERAGVVAATLLLLMMMMMAAGVQLVLFQRPACSSRAGPSLGNAYLYAGWQCAPRRPRHGSFGYEANRSGWRQDFAWARGAGGLRNIVVGGIVWACAPVCFRSGARVCGHMSCG